MAREAGTLRGMYSIMPIKATYGYILLYNAV